MQNWAQVIGKSDWKQGADESLTVSILTLCKVPSYGLFWIPTSMPSLGWKNTGWYAAPKWTTLLSWWLVDLFLQQKGLLCFQRQRTCAVRLEGFSNAVNCISARSPPKGITAPEHALSRYKVQKKSPLQSSQKLALTWLLRSKQATKC